MDADFLAALGDHQRPVPGGGAAAAHAAVVGIVLLYKIAGVEKARSGARNYWRGIQEQLRAIKERLEGLRQEDGQAYLDLAAARRRDEASCQGATAAAIDCPLEIGYQAVAGLQQALQATTRVRRHLLTDVLAAAEILAGGAKAAAHIAAANLALLAADSQAYQQRVANLRRQSDALLEEVKGKAAERFPSLLSLPGS